MKNIIICGVIKNGIVRIEHNILACDALGKYFDNYKIIIYENNSTDGTKDILKKIKDNNKNIVLLSEDLTKESIKKNSKVWSYTEITGSDHPCRIEQICNARNKVVDELRKEKYNNYSVVVWIDIDSNGFNIDSIKDSINKVLNDDKLVLFGNSNPRYYDYYVFRAGVSPIQLLGPELYGELFWEKVYYEISFEPNQHIPVYSAFNGVGVYPKKAFDNNQYGILLNDKIKRVYKSILDKYPKLRGYCDGILKKKDSKFPGGYYDKELDVFWKYNSGYNNILIPEHVFLNFSLIDDGYKLFIDTNIDYRWS